MLEYFRDDKVLGSTKLKVYRSKNRSPLKRRPSVVEEFPTDLLGRAKADALLAMMDKLKDVKQIDIPFEENAELSEAESCARIELVGKGRERKRCAIHHTTVVNRE